MRIGLILIAVAALAGCDREAERAEEEYKFLSNSYGSEAEKCRAASRAVQAYIKRGDKIKYLDWKITQTRNCANY